MCSRFLSVTAVVIVAAIASCAGELRVCADPNNLPFSNQEQQGFENRIARVIARDLKASVHYEWQRMGRGFVREILNKGRCDVLLGIPTNFRAVLTTQPYYRSGYVFVTREDRRLHLTSFDDSRLRGMKIGVQIVGEEYAPPGQALGRRGLADNIVGFDTVAKPNSIIRAVLNGQVDAAIVWGPLAGYLAKRHPGKLELTAVPQSDPPLPMAFSISLGVRKKDTALRDELNAALRRDKPAIDRILRDYGVPMMSGAGGTAE
jgi:mxaJ protein